MILVTGANGNLGRLVVDELIARVDPATVIATARSTEKLQDLAGTGVQIRTLDYDRPETIEAALDGVTQVLLISSSAIGQRVAQHTAVINAAAKAGVEHFAYTSLLHADTSTMFAAQEHKATEEALAKSDLNATLLRNGWYIENYTENLAPALEHKALIGSAGDGQIAAASRADFAAAAAAVLTNTDLWGGTYELGGPAFTMSELANIVSDAIAETIPYVDMPGDAYREALIGAGLSGDMADFLVDSDLGIARGQLNAESTTLEQLVDRPLVTLGAAVASALA